MTIDTNVNKVIFSLSFTRTEIKKIYDCIIYNQEIPPTIRVKIYEMAISKIKLLHNKKSESLFMCNIIKNIIYTIYNILSVDFIYISLNSLHNLLPEFTKDNCIKLAIKNKWRRIYVPLDGCAWFYGNYAKPRIMFLNWCIKVANANNNNDSTSISSSTGVQ